MAFVVEEKIGEENVRKHSLDKVQKDIRDKIFKCDCLFAVKKQWITGYRASSQDAKIRA